jgi:hypothetical protein
LFAAPIVLVALVAIPVVFRMDRLWTYAAGGAVAAYFVVGAGFSAWWLATSPPGRNWTPLLPLAVPFLACALQRMRPLARSIIVTLALALAMLFAALPLSVYPDGPGVTTVWERVHLDRLMPTLRPDVGRTSIGFGIVLLVLIAAGVTAAAIHARRTWLQRDVQPSNVGSPRPL